MIAIHDLTGVFVVQAFLDDLGVQIECAANQDRIFGMPLDEWLDLKAIAVHPLEKAYVCIPQRLAFVNPLQQALGSGQAVFLETQHQDRDGSSIKIFLFHKVIFAIFPAPGKFSIGRGTGAVNLALN